MPVNKHQGPKFKVVSILAIEIIFFFKKNYSFNKMGPLSFIFKLLLIS